MNHPAQPDPRAGTSSPTTPAWCASPRARRRTRRTSPGRSRPRWRFPRAARKECCSRTADASAGWGLYLLKGKPVFCYNLAGVARYYVAGKDKLTPGAHTIVYDFKYDGAGLGKGGVGTIQVDGKTVATGRIERTLAFRLSLDETLDCGEDTGTPVSEDYHVPFKFTGEIKKVTVDLKPVPLTAEDQRKL